MAEQMQAILDQEGTPLDKEESERLAQVLARLEERVADLARKLPHKLLDRCIRGYATYPDPVADTAEAVRALVEWRETNKVDDMLTQEIPGQENFHKVWPSRVYGSDAHGHVVVVERLSDLDIKGLCELDIAALLALRAQYYEALECVKTERSATRCKMVFLLDVGALSLREHFSSGSRARLQPLLALGQEYYPESLWRLYIVNTPAVFRGVWNVVKAWIHPITREKIRLVGNLHKNRAQFEKDGVLLSDLPADMGGEHKGELMIDHIRRFIAQSREERARPPHALANGDGPARKTEQDAEPVVGKEEVQGKEKGEKEEKEKEDMKAAVGAAAVQVAGNGQSDGNNAKSSGSSPRTAAGGEGAGAAAAAAAGAAMAVGGDGAVEGDFHRMPRADYFEMRLAAP